MGVPLARERGTFPIFPVLGYWFAGKMGRRGHHAEGGGRGSVVLDLAQFLDKGFQHLFHGAKPRICGEVGLQFLCDLFGRFGVG